MNVVLFEEMDADIIRLLESICGTPMPVSIKEMTQSLEKRKILQIVKEPIKLNDLFARLDCR